MLEVLEMKMEKEMSRIVKKLENRIVVNSNSEIEVFSKEVGEPFEFIGEIPEESLPGFYFLDGVCLTFCKKAPTMVVVA